MNEELIMAIMVIAVGLIALFSILRMWEIFYRIFKGIQEERSSRPHSSSCSGKIYNNRFRWKNLPFPCTMACIKCGDPYYY